MLQIGDSFFAGSYEDVSGTNMILEAVSSEETNVNSTPTLQYMCKGTKKIKFREVFLFPKNKS